MFANNSASAVALAAADPTRDGDMVMILLGAAVDAEMVACIADAPGHMPVVSFGVEYIVQLPSHAGGWAAEVPPPGTPCIVISSQGSEPSQQKLYLRVNFAPPGAGFKACYFDVKDGRILASPSQLHLGYQTPTGICGYAVEWALLTKESEPRVILSYRTAEV
jgi:hypothetical protein